MEPANYFVYESDHEIKYTNHDIIPIREVIKSLLAFEKLIGETPFVLNALTGFDGIERVEVYISTLQSGSLLEKFVVKYFFKDEAGFDAWIQKIREKTGMEDGKLIVPTLIGGSIAAVTLLGLQWASQPNIDSSSTINGNNNVVIQYVAQNLNMTPDQVKTTIENAIKDKKSVATNAVKAVQPAKLDASAKIEIDGENQLEITTPTIAATPEAYEPPVPQTKTESYVRTLIQIRQVNLDDLAAGWRVVIPGISDKRLPLVVSDGIDAKALMRSGGVIQASIDVIKKYDSRKKDYVISEVFLKEWEAVK